MPPDVREWSPSRHLAWFVIDAVADMDLEAFYAAYRVDGRSRPPYDPAMMVALLLYADARGIRSSRVIERACEEDVAFWVLAAQHRPDRATIARFVERHQDAIAGLFGEVLTLCARSGLAKVGVIAVDGTKVQANASRDENLDYEQLAREIVEEAKAVDAAEDELYGEARGDELLPEFATAQGRRGWLREAKQRLEAERASNPQPVPRSRPRRLREAKNVPGRETDVQDAQWLCRLLEHGLLKSSFVPPRPIRELSDLTRYRKALIWKRGREANRVQKVLEDANIKLASVASRPLGASGKAMLRALCAGEADPRALADLAKGKLRAKLPALKSRPRGSLPRAPRRARIAPARAPRVPRRNGRRAHARDRAADAPLRAPA